jgi:hypothetical protein
MSQFDFTALIQASASGDTPFVKTLLDAGADLNGTSTVRLPRRRPAPAAARRHSLTRRAPLFFWQSGRTALYYARQRNHPEVVALLEAAQQGGGAGGAAAGGGAAAAGATAASAASSSASDVGGAGARQRARTESEQGELNKQLFDAAWSVNYKTAEVTRLLAAGADPNGHKDAVRACARAASLPAALAPLPRPCHLRGTQHPRHAAAVRRRVA